MSNARIDARLAAIYNRIPPMADCKGHCWNSCGAIDMSARERQLIEEAGYRITPNEVAREHKGTFWCEALTAEGRCGIYSIRPLVCRLWGVMPSLRCPFGCVPEGGWVDDIEGLALLAEADEIGGGGSYPPGTAELIRTAPPHLRQAVLEYLRAGNDISRYPERSSTVLPPEVTRRKPVAREQ